MVLPSRATASAQPGEPGFIRSAKTASTCFASLGSSAAYARHGIAVESSRSVTLTARISLRISIGSRRNRGESNYIWRQCLRKKSLIQWRYVDCDYPCGEPSVGGVRVELYSTCADRYANCTRTTPCV